MKVLIHTYDTAFQNRAGGVHNRIMRTVNSLKAMGIEVDFYDKYNIDLTKYDVLHVFKLDHSSHDLIEYAHKKGLKVVISTILSLEKGGIVDLYWKLRKLPLATIYKLTFNCLMYADAIIVETPREAKFISRYYHVPEEKIMCIPNGADDISTHDELIYQKLGEKVEYGIIVSRFDKNKNQLSVISALADSDVSIVFIGGPDPNSEKYYQACLDKAKSNKKMYFLGWLDPKDPLLKSAIGNAKLIICPSFRETFGLSIIEGIMAGATPVVSNTLPILEYKSLRNIKTFNPNDIEDIKEAIASEMRKKIDYDLKTTISDEFSWETVASQHLEVYSKVLL